MAVLSPHPDDRAGLLDDILTRSRIRCEFQPVVDLASGKLVAVEARARGPQGSPLERPSRLFATARTLGRVPALDWTCRVAAITAAADCGLPEGCALFINVDPAALAAPTPEWAADAITDALQAYAAEHGATIITEGIESPVHLDTARALGATLAQGWHFARPDDLVATLADHAAGHSSGPIES